MRTFNYIVKIKMGIHARPASSLFTLSRRFKSEIYIIYKERRGNTKRIVDIIELNTKKGSRIKFEIEGIDEDHAYECIVAFCHTNL